MARNLRLPRFSFIHLSSLGDSEHRVSRNVCLIATSNYSSWFYPLFHHFSCLIILTFFHSVSFYLKLKNSFQFLNSFFIRPKYKSDSQYCPQKALESEAIHQAYLFIHSQKVHGNFLPGSVADSRNTSANETKRVPFYVRKT